MIEANSLLHGQETDVFADAGNQGAHKRPDATQERFDTLRASHAEDLRGLRAQQETAREEARSCRSEAERSQVELSTERTDQQRVEAELGALRMEHGQVTTQLTAQLEGA